MADDSDNTETQVDQQEPQLIDREPQLIDKAPQVPEKIGQIPLLDDVVYNTSLPFAKPKPRPRQPEVDDEHAPRATDLFGGSPDTAISGPYSSGYDAKDMDAVASRLRTGTERVVDNLVAEYSQEIVGRLRQELTTLLDELNDNPPKQDPE